jgi:hypothetical protein
MIHENTTPVLPAWGCTPPPNAPSIVHLLHFDLHPLLGTGCRSSCQLAKVSEGTMIGYDWVMMTLYKLILARGRTLLLASQVIR